MVFNVKIFYKFWKLTIKSIHPKKPEIMSDKFFHDVLSKIKSFMEVAF